jgi:transposase
MSRAQHILAVIVGLITGVLLMESYGAMVEAGRLRSAAAFAALAGVNPIPASSGQVTRHRLNRSGDRQLNRALHTIVLARLRDDAQTRAYAARRRAEGKSPRDIRRCRSERSPGSCSTCWRAAIRHGWRLP